MERLIEATSSNISEIRGQVWALLNDCKFKEFVLEGLIDKYQRIDRGINIFLAIASSGSIAAWALWKEVPLLWATIIAFSQVFLTIKPYFPFYKYVKEMNSKKLGFVKLAIDLEKLWYKIQNQKIDNNQIPDEYFELKGTLGELESFGDETIFKVSKAREKAAEDRMRVFLKKNYSVIIP